MRSSQCQSAENSNLPPQPSCCVIDVDQIGNNQSKIIFPGGNDNGGCCACAVAVAVEKVGHDVYTPIREQSTYKG